MAACSGSLAADILNDCASKPVGGTEQVVYLFNRTELTATIDGSNANLATNLAVALTKKGYKLTGFRKNMNAGADIIVSDTSPKKWNQFFSFYQWSVVAAGVKAIDNLDDVVVVYESKNKGASSEGAFHMLGYPGGLYVSKDTKRVNDNDGNRSIELTCLPGSESLVSEHIVMKTSYALTYAMLEALMAVQT